MLQGVFMALPLVLTILLTTRTKGAKAAKGGLSPEQWSDAKSLGARHVRARQVGMWAAIVCAIAIIGLAWTMWTPETGEDPTDRVVQVCIGGITLCLWIFCAAYGIFRGYQRIRYGTALPSQKP
jgi:hypothetical protein